MIRLAGCVVLAAVLAPAPAHAAAREIRLPPARLLGAVSVEATLEARRSVRSLSKQALGVTELAQLLWAAQGQSAPDGRRTAPSARRTYPLELGVIVRSVEGLRPAAYRYVSGRHALEPLPAAKVEELARSTSQAHVGSAPVVFVVAAVYERIGDGPGSPTGVDFEAGAASENLLLQATALGIGTCVVGGFDPEVAKRAVGFTGRERVIVLIPAGRPED